MLHTGCGNIFKRVAPLSRTLEAMDVIMDRHSLIGLKLSRLDFWLFTSNERTNEVRHRFDFRKALSLVEVVREVMQVVIAHV